MSSSEPPEWFAELPRWMQEIFVQMGWAGAEASWLSASEFEGAPPDWAKMAGLIRGTGFLWGALEALPGAGGIPLLGTLAPSYAYGIFETMYRSGMVPSVFGGEEWTFAGRAQWAQDLYSYHLGRAMQSIVWGYEPTSYRQGAMQLAQARMAYWGARQDLSTLSIVYAMARLASFPAVSGATGEWPFRAFGWTMMGPITQMQYAQAMMPHVAAAWATSDPFVQQQIRSSPSFWPFHVRPWQEELAAGLGAWTGIQTGLYGLSGLLRKPAFEFTGQFQYQGFGPFGAAGAPVFEEMSLTSRLWEAIKPQLGVSLLQAGLGIGMSVLSEMSIRGAAGISPTREELESWAIRGGASVGATAAGFTAQSLWGGAFNIGPFSASTLLTMGQYWAGQTLRGFLTQQMADMMGLTGPARLEAWNQTLAQLQADRWGQVLLGIGRGTLMQPFTEALLQPWTGVTPQPQMQQGIFNLDRMVLQGFGGLTAGLLDILGFKSSAAGIRTWTESITRPSTTGGLVDIPGMAESIAWDTFAPQRSALQQFRGGISAIAALGLGTAGLWGGADIFEAIKPLWSRYGGLTASYYREIGKFFGTLGHQFLADYYAKLGPMLQGMRFPGEQVPGTGIYENFPDALTFQVYQMQSAMRFAYEQVPGTSIYEDPLWAAEQRRFEALSMQLGRNVWQGYWEIFGAAPWVKTMPKWGGIMRQVTWGLQFQQLQEMYAQGLIKPAQWEMLQSLYTAGTIKYGITDIFKAAGVSPLYGGWTGVGMSFIQVPEWQAAVNQWRVSQGLPEMPVWTSQEVTSQIMSMAGYLLGAPITPTVAYPLKGAVTGLPWGKIFSPTSFWQEFMAGGPQGVGALYGTEYGIFGAAMSETGHAAILKALAANRPIPPEWQALYDYLRLSGQLPQMPGNSPPSAAHTQALTLARRLNITLEEALAMIESGYVQTAGGLIASINLTPGQRAWFEFAAEQEAAGGGPGSEPASTWTPTRGTVPLIVGTGQYGMDQIITRPTRIRVLVGESGPEHVKVTPLGRAEVERLIDRKVRAGRRSIDELEWNMSIAFSKRVIRGVTARG